MTGTAVSERIRQKTRSPLGVRVNALFQDHATRVRAKSETKKTRSPVRKELLGERMNAFSELSVNFARTRTLRAKRFIQKMRSPVRLSADGGAHD